MADDLKPAEKSSVAGTEGTKSQVEGIDYEALLKEQAARLAKAEEAAANYKKGMLKYKSQVKQDSGDEPDQMEMMRQVAEEVLTTSEVSQEKKRLEEMMLQQARELKEAKLALANRSQTQTSQGSGSSGSTPTADKELSPEQIAALKARGWDEKKIEKFKENRKKMTGITY